MKKAYTITHTLLSGSISGVGGHKPTWVLQCRNVIRLIETTTRGAVKERREGQAGTRL